MLFREFRSRCLELRLSYYFLRWLSILIFFGDFGAEAWACHHDINYLHDVKDEFSNCVLIGDKGYRSNPRRLTLFEYAGIELAPSCRKNELIQYTMPEDYQRLRKRMEVVFSQLVDQFSIRKSYAQSQRGLFLKVISKITLFTLLQYVNYQEKRSLCQLRYTLSA